VLSHIGLSSEREKTGFLEAGAPVPGTIFLGALLRAEMEMLWHFCLLYLFSDCVANLTIFLVRA
jgi:hypothetical protein